MEKQMLEGKSAIITGPSYGMGRTMAERERTVRGQVLQVCNGAFL